MNDDVIFKAFVSIMSAAVGFLFFGSVAASVIIYIGLPALAVPVAVLIAIACGLGANWLMNGDY